MIKRKEGISFCIITGGQREDRLESLIKSIRAMNVPDSEILVCGIHHKDKQINYAEKIEWAQNAQVCKMRNFNGARASYNTLVMLDDDVEFSPDWYENIKDENDFDIAGCRGIDGNAKRWWDYQKIERSNPLASPILLEYGDSNPDAYISGYFMMIKTPVWEAVKFDEERRNYQHDDVDFCHRALDAGYSIKIFPQATVIHHVDGRGREESEKARVEYVSTGQTDGSDEQEAKKLMLSKNYLPAIASLKKILKKASAFQPLYDIAYCYHQIGALNGAVVNYLAAVGAKGEKDDSRVASAYFHLGEIYAAKKIDHLAENFFSLAVQHEPKHQKAVARIYEINQKKGGCHT